MLTLIIHLVKYDDIAMITFTFLYWKAIICSIDINYGFFFFFFSFFSSHL